MQIKRIDYLKDFGSFRDFCWNCNKMNDFERVNLIYGYNGMGKTMLSRFFAYLSQTPITINNEENFFQENFSCTTTEGKISHFSNDITKDKILVFNQDFINRELKFSETKANKIVYYDIGSDAISLKDKLTQTNSRQKNISEYINTQKNALNKLEQEKNRLQELYQNNVIVELGIKKQLFRIDVATEYIQKNVKKEISQLTNSEKENLVKQYKQQKKLNIPNEISLADFFISIDKLEILASICEQSYVRSSTQSLRDEILDWIERGCEFQKEENTKCLFCGQTISADYWINREKEILNIINKDEVFIEKKKQLQSFLNLLQSFLSKNFTIKLRTEDFYPQFQEEFQKNAQNFDQIFLQTKKYFQTLIDLVLTKTKDLSVPIVLRQQESYQKLIELTKKAIQTEENIKNLCFLHNKYTLNIEKLQKEAEEKIKYSLVADIKKEFLNNHEKAITTQEKLSKANSILNKLSEKKKAIHDSLANQTQPIEEIEKYINQITGNLGYIRINYNAETQEYFLERLENSHYKPAKLLSEGEKNIIAFSYFLALIKEKIKTHIIVIDDPISSLDQNHFFNILHLIFNLFFSDPNLVNQIFILTHNFFFFRKLRKMIKGNKLYQTDSSGKTLTGQDGKPIGRLNKHTNKNNLEDKQIYLLTKNGTTSTITFPTKFLLKFNTEYCALVDCIRKFKDDYNQNTFDHEQGALIVNAMRRVVEYILSFKYPNSNMSDNFNKSLKGEHPEWTYLLSILNLESHSEDTHSSLDYSCYAQMKQCITDFEAYIDFVDSEHFQAFYGKNNTIC